MQERFVRGFPRVLILLWLCASALGILAGVQRHACKMVVSKTPWEVGGRCVVPFVNAGMSVVAT